MFKDPQYAVDQLCDLYGRFDAGERLMADRVIDEWALSDDEGVRYDAQALIRRYSIVRAAEVLRKLAIRLESTMSPGAPFELKKVNQILVSLAAADKEH